MKKNLFFLVTLLFFIRLPFSSATSLPNPNTNWKTISSEKFEIIFAENSEEIANLTLQNLETAHKKLSKIWTPPKQIIRIVIREETDVSNGYASPLPYPHIVIYPTTPSFSESIGEYKDWLYELTLHELIHVFTFEQRRGATQFLWYVFGSVLTPNILLPRWWLEGVAVDGESRFSQGGRMRSLYYETFLRLQAQKGDINSITLSSINEYRIPTWPYGNRPYLYGPLIWNHIFETSGETVNGPIHFEAGGRIPYFINKPLQNNTPFNSFQQVFEEAKISVTQKSLNQINTLNQSPLTPISNFKLINWQEAHSPVISPDGKRLAFVTKEKNLNKTIRVITRSTLTQSFRDLESNEIVEEESSIGSPQGPGLPLPDTQSNVSTQRISWFPQSNAFIYDSIGSISPYEARSDLWMYSFKTKKKTQLTRGLRAREPSLSPLGQQIAFVQLGSLNHKLSLLKLKSKGNTKSDIITLFDESGHFVHWPTWIDENTLVANIKTPESENLILFNIETKTHKKLDIACSRPRFPQYFNQKLFFSCDKNGTWNIYQISLNSPSDIIPLSHLISGVWSFTLDAKTSSLIATHGTSKGFQIGEIDLKITPNSPLPTIEPIFNHPSKINVEKTQNTLQNNFLISNDYKSSHYLLPRYWIPFFYTSDKSTSFLISTQNFDPLQKQSYGVQLLFDQVTQSINYSLNYVNRITSWPIRFFTIQETSYLADPNQKTGNQQIGFGFYPPLFDNPHEQFYFGLAYNKKELLTAQSKQIELQTNYSQSKLLTSPYYHQPIGGNRYQIDLGIIQNSSPDVPWIYKVTLSSDHYFQPFGDNNGSLKTHLTGYYLDQFSALTNFQSTQSWQIGNSPAFSIMRGYSTGAFFGPKFGILNLEYWLPGLRIDKGLTYLAGYFHQIYFGFVSDFISMDGYGLNPISRTYTRLKGDQIFSSAGVEMLLDFNLGYHIDMKVVFGTYWVPDSSLGNGDQSWSLGFRL